MLERPILFNSEMVRAILDGRKTQTRRPFEHAFQNDVSFEFIEKACLRGVINVRNAWVSRHADGSYGIRQGVGIKCPFGVPGDRLWVRETWGAWPHMNGGFQMDSLRFRADGEYQNEHNAWRWRPSIHMPRWASRITLEITAVRVERLQDITFDGAAAEGFPQLFPTLKFSETWDSIYAAQNLGWDQNPYVWVVEFKRLEPQP